MQKTLKPTPSKLLAKYAEEIVSNSDGIIVDAASGYGRNATLLSLYGASVVCVDINSEALESIKSSHLFSEPTSNNPGQISTLKLDMVEDPWPFADESVSAIINVHFFDPRIIDPFLRSLKIGGYLFIETVDDRGGNYLSLPEYGFIKDKLGDSFEIKYYKEKKAGPPESNASTVKLLAVKRKRICPEKDG